jgi:hypothetical protein
MINNSSAMPADEVVAIKFSNPDVAAEELTNSNILSHLKSETNTQSHSVVAMADLVLSPTITPSKARLISPICRHGC